MAPYCWEDGQGLLRGNRCNVTYFRSLDLLFAGDDCI